MTEPTVFGDLKKALWRIYRVDFYIMVLLSETMKMSKSPRFICGLFKIYLCSFHSITKKLLTVHQRTEQSPVLIRRLFHLFIPLTQKDLRWLIKKNNPAISLLSPDKDCVRTMTASTGCRAWGMWAVGVWNAAFSIPSPGYKETTTKDALWLKQETGETLLGFFSKGQGNIQCLMVQAWEI